MHSKQEASNVRSYKHVCSTQAILLHSECAFEKLILPSVFSCSCIVNPWLQSASSFYGSVYPSYRNSNTYISLNSVYLPTAHSIQHICQHTQMMKPKSLDTVYTFTPQATSTVHTPYHLNFLTTNNAWYCLCMLLNLSWVLHGPCTDICLIYLKESVYVNNLWCDEINRRLCIWTVIIYAYIVWWLSFVRNLGILSEKVHHLYERVCGYCSHSLLYCMSQ